MSSIIDPATSALVGMALDAAAMRQQAIAHNIANANTPGYRRMSVSFERQLDALRDGDGEVRMASPASLGEARPVFTTAADEGAVSLDVEVADLSRNTLQHQALVKAMSKYYALFNTAINEGKR